MHIIIIGGGDIGYPLANALSAEHDVFLVDRDPLRAHRFSHLDVEFVAGSGTSPDVLRRGRRREVRPADSRHPPRRGEHRRLLVRQRPRREADDLLRHEGRPAGAAERRRQPATQLRHRRDHLAGSAARGGDRAHHHGAGSDRRGDVRRRPDRAARVPPRGQLAGRRPRGGVALAADRRRHHRPEAREFHLDSARADGARARRQGGPDGDALRDEAPAFRHRPGERRRREPDGDHHRRRRRRFPAGAESRRRGRDPASSSSSASASAANCWPRRSATR